MKKIASPESKKSPSRPDTACPNRARVFVVSLGCPKNLIDTEYALGSLGARAGGLEFCKDQDQADIILVNTCSFIEEAVSESIEAILQAAQGKRPGQILAVMGCLPLRYRKELKELLPEVDIFSFSQDPVETGQIFSSCLGSVSSARAISSAETINRISTGMPWQKYVKISDGCSNRCTYCLIPSIKGRMVCRKPGLIAEEINMLCEAGAKEITLVAQDLSAYEMDGLDLASLVEFLLRETDVPWLRLMYLYPGGLDDRLLDLMDHNDRLCPYVDMPIQHASSSVLRSMGRNYDQDLLEQTIGRIKNFLPQVSIRTTVMTGFPGETEEDFETLRDFIERWKFHHLGCFTYSDEEDAPSRHLKHKVPPEVARERKEELMSLQARISAGINAGFQNQVLDILLEGLCQETNLLLCGRTRFQAPEVDGLTYINSGEAQAGQIVKVKITETHTYDLVGEVLQGE